MSHHHNLMSTGRGGAGNMIEAKISAATSIGTRTSAVNSDGELVDGSANEIILTQDEWEHYAKGKAGKKVMRRGSSKGVVIPKIDEDHEREEVGNPSGLIFASSGRGGVGNMTKTNRQPSAHIISEKEENMQELSPIFSTGRGGAGNIYKTRSHSGVKVPRIDTELSPLHSGIREGEVSNADIVLDATDRSAGRKGLLGRLKGFFK